MKSRYRLTCLGAMCICHVHRLRTSQLPHPTSPARSPGSTGPWATCASGSRGRRCQESRPSRRTWVGRDDEDIGDVDGIAPNTSRGPWSEDHFAGAELHWSNGCVETCDWQSCAGTLVAVGKGFPRNARPSSAHTSRSL